MQVMALALLGIVAIGVMWLSRVWRTGQGDPTIDELIAAKGCRVRPGMATADQHVLDRMGQLRWQETLAAQRAGQRSVAERQQEARKRARARRFFRVA